MARALAALVVLALAVPAAADAASVELHYLHGPDPRSGRTHHTFGLVYVADPGEANRLTLRRDGNAVEVSDPGATIRSGINCVPVTGGARCTATYDQAAIDVSTADLGDMEDHADFGSFGAGSVRGGDGEDTINGGGYLDGGAVADTLAVGPYAYVDGGPGGDRITGEQSSLKYEGRTDGVTVTFDGAANDGAAGEGDDIRGTFDSIQGTPGDDLLYASGGGRSNWISGLAGNDRLIGSGENDRLVGGPGDDVVEGHGGNDEMNGDEGSDLIRGGPGTDGVYVLARFASMSVTLDDQRDDGVSGEGDDYGADVENVYAGNGSADHVVGTNGPNAIDVGSGGDTVLARGGDDVISFFGGGASIDLGAGHDSFHGSSRARTGDTIRMRDGEVDTGPRCEVGARPTIEADAFDDLNACASFLDLPDESQRLQASVSGIALLRATCARVGTPRCTGELRLYETPTPPKRRMVLARRRYDVPAGKTRSIRMTITKTGRNALTRSARVQFLASSHPDLNPPPVVSFPSAFETVNGILLRPR